jgi:hypothetical protein
MSLWHWNDNIVLLGASIVDILNGVFLSSVLEYKRSNVLDI